MSYQDMLLVKTGVKYLSLALCPFAVPAVIQILLWNEHDFRVLLGAIKISRKDH
jgi:hypothetical protein